MYRELIAATTGIADPKVLARIEDYMRNVIFHSMLDWQSSAQLKRAAKTAARELPMLDAMLRRA
jgi:hypothetical protein